MTDKNFYTTPFDYFVYDVANQTTVQNAHMPSMKLDRLREEFSNDLHLQPFSFESSKCNPNEVSDAKYPAIKSRILCQNCMHNKSHNQTCYNFMDFITTIIEKQNSYGFNWNESECRFLILCKHCITTLISNSVFLSRWNKWLITLQNISKDPSKVTKNEQIISLTLCILSAFFICPKIAKQMFLKYWKKLFSIFRNLLQLIDQIGSEIFLPFTDRTRNSKTINSDPVFRRHFNSLRSICNSLSSHIHRVDLFFTSKHWKYFVKHKLFELIVKATFYEYIAMHFQNKDGVRIDFTGKTMENCFYTEWFFTAYGCNSIAKYSKIFKKSHLKAMTSILNHPRMNHPHFVPRSSILWKMIAPDRNVNRTELQFWVFKISQDYWKIYKASKECHSPNCNKIEFYLVKYRKRISFKKCKGCQIVFYCSKHCQKFDWSRGEHRLYCKTLHIFNNEI